MLDHYSSSHQVQRNNPVNRMGMGRAGAGIQTDHSEEAALALNGEGVH